MLKAERRESVQILDTGCLVSVHITKNKRGVLAPKCYGRTKDFLVYRERWMNPTE